MPLERRRLARRATQQTQLVCADVHAFRQIAEHPRFRGVVRGIHELAICTRVPAGEHPAVECALWCVLLSASGYVERAGSLPARVVTQCDVVEASGGRSLECRELGRYDGSYAGWIVVIPCVLSEAYKAVARRFVARQALQPRHSPDSDAEQQLVGQTETDTLL